jgi:ferredoxin
VEERAAVLDARCTACLDCVDACPTKGRRTLALTLPGARRRTVAPAALAASLVAVLGAGVALAALWPVPSFRWSRGDLPAVSASFEAEVGELTCRGRANLLSWYLDRDDDLAVPGPLRLEAWPAPEGARARFHYDPARTTPDAIRAALSEPYHDLATGALRTPPFVVEGWDPLAPR